MNRENKAKLKAALKEAYAEKVYETSTVICRRVYMQPFGKARPKVTKFGTYMPADYNWRKDRLAELFGAIEFNALPVSLKVLAVRGMPKSWSKRKREQTAGLWCEAKPDADNILGAVMDALFPVSDSSVVDSGCAKIWGYADCLQITVMSANGLPIPVLGRPHHQPAVQL